MKKKLLAIFLAVSMALSFTACNSSGNKDSSSSKKEEPAKQTQLSDKNDDKKDAPLPFGFTPKEFNENFSNFSSFDDLTVTEFVEQVPDSWYMKIDSPNGSSYFFSIISDSNGKVCSIITDTIDDEYFQKVVKATISSIDINFDSDEIVKELGLPEVPKTTDDYRRIVKNGIGLILGPSNFIIGRDEKTASQYNYQKIYSNSKSEADSISSGEATDILQDSNSIGQANALSSAKSYLDIMAFSYSGLIEQLEYDGYSNEDATYAADNCEADWNEQAAKSAQSYLDTMAFSRSELIEQLIYEGFSQEQAEYGISAIGY